MQMAKKKKQIDKPLLRDINDYANGGFILFSFDENGFPEVNSYFDDASKALALQHYIQNWSLAIETVTLENTVALMEREMEEEEPPELPPNEDDDDDEKM